MLLRSCLRGWLEHYVDLGHLLVLGVLLEGIELVQSLDEGMEDIMRRGVLREVDGALLDEAAIEDVAGGRRSCLRVSRIFHLFLIAIFE